MKYFSLFVLLFAFSSVSAQFYVNNPLNRGDEFLVFSDSSKHTQIKSSVYNLKYDADKECFIEISPAFNVSSGVDSKFNNFCYDFFVGADLKSSFKNKLFVNALGYYGLYKPEPFFSDFTDSTGIMPGTDILKRFDSGNYGYFNFIANLIYKPKDYIYFEIGKGKTFIGDGYRSLLMSDNSIAYPYFRTVVEVWKVKYLYQISSMKGHDYRLSETDWFNKFVFTHYLSFNIGKRLNFSMFETIVQSSRDSLLLPRGIELNYLNPVIFLRPVEYNIGSPDNVLVGFSGHLKIFKSGMLYGQVFIDEFIRSHITSFSDEYWDEKYGIQGGMKFYNTFGIEKLYTQFEANAVRPYTYSHADGIGAYTNLNQPLAHPLGSNFVEGLGIIGYSWKDFYFQTKVVYSKYGDNDTLNYGHIPELSYNTRVSDDNVQWLQGVPTTLQYAEFMIAFTKKFNYSVTAAYRKVNNQKSLLLMFGISSQLFYNRYYDWN